MKKGFIMIMSVVLFLCFQTVVCAEEEITIELPVVKGTGSWPTAAPNPTRDNSVVPFAVVSWGDTAEKVAKATSGEIGEQNGVTIVTASAQVEGLSNEIPVIYSFDENGLNQAEAIAADYLVEKITDLTASAAGQAMIKQTEDFFKGEDHYTWNGTGTKHFMAPNTTAGLHCRENNGTYRLSIVYYPPEPFDISIIEASGDIENRREDGHDMQYFPLIREIDSEPFIENFNFYLDEIISVKEYQREERRVPAFILALYCNGSFDLGNVQNISFLVDGKQYTFTNLKVSDSSTNTSTVDKTYSAIMGENSFPFWEALSATQNPVTFSYTFATEGHGVSDGHFEIPESDVAKLVRGYRLYQEAHGLSKFALDFVSGYEATLSVMDQEEIALLTPEYTLDSSAVPFAEISWDIKMNNISKALGIKAEKEGNTQVIQSAVSIEGLGENIPLTYIFRNNKLACAKLMISRNEKNDKAFFASAKGQQIQNYIKSFIGTHPHFSYSDANNPFEYTITDKTEIAFGILKNRTGYDLSMEFFPAQKYDVAALKKNSKISAFPQGEKSILYYDTDPFFFKHGDTYSGRRFTYSWFTWGIMMREYAQSIGKMPVLYYWLTYSGIRNPSSTKWLSFSIDNEVYRFELKSSDIGQLSKTQYGELQQDFGFFIDCNNYEFLEKLSKGRRIEVVLQGDSFNLTFDLPAKAKQKIIEGMKYFEKVCGIIDGPLAFNQFSGTPLSIY